VRGAAWTGLQVVCAVALLWAVFAVRDRFGLGWSVALFVAPTLVGAAVIGAVALAAHRRRRRRLLDQEFRE
jgi:hypothetical protein